VFFENVEAGIKLAGTLTMPSGGKELPAVVLIAGSGRNDRDETSMGHFLLLSDFLTRNGYAVLRYDKRGVGESEGDYAAANTFDFADDAKAALKYLKSRPETVPHQTGLIGHSEGALIAPIIAAEHQDELGFMVMMGGIGIPGTKLLLLQSAKMAAISGMSEEQITELTALNRTLYTIAQSNESDTVVERKLKEAAPDIDPNQLQMLQWPWFRTFLALDPHTYLSKVTCPALAITGEKDVQCPPDENLSAMEHSLREAGNQNFEIVEMAGLNHLFQTAKSGSPLEYEQIAEIISPDALQTILDWMDETIKHLGQSGVGETP
jgi:pimeloyl-ACP methyl ester carboxylesterase